MGSFFNGLKRAAKSWTEGEGPGRYEVQGRPVRCPHCGGDQFADGEAPGNTLGLTFLSFDWSTQSTSTLMCAECSRIEWFGQKPTRLA